MKKTRPYILTIAGFDPTSGAGITADLKTIEQLKCYGLAVQTANTIQTHNQFLSCNWIDEEVIKKQLTVLLEAFPINYVKVGIIQDWKLLSEIITIIKSKSAHVKIVLDPVLQSTTQFQFNKNEEEIFDKILKDIYLLTPNYQEIQQLFKDKSIEESIKHITSQTNLFLKGGHKQQKIGQDVLFTKEGEQYVMNPKKQNYTEKHGSGCVLASSITSYLAQGFPLMKSCYKAKRYIEQFLSSNKTLLGYHK